MSLITYTINFTSGIKSSFTVSPGTFNGPQRLLEIPPGPAATSLNLPGQGTLRYGELMDENIIHLLENFADSVPPVLPTTGQIWFDTAENLLKWYGYQALPYHNEATTKDWTPVVSKRVSPIPAATDGDLLVESNVGATGVASYYAASAFAGQTIVNLPWSYALGTNQLLVYVQGVKQAVGVDFTEISTTSISIGAGLALGDRIEIYAFPAVDTIQQHSVTATLGQTVFNLPWSYAVGVDQLLVYVQGVKQIVAVDFTETSPTAVTFGVGLALGDRVEFIGVPATYTMQQDVQTSLLGQTVFNLPWSYTTNGAQTHVFIQGVKQVVNVDYVETSSTSIIFGSGLGLGDQVEVYAFPFIPQVNRVSVMVGGTYRQFWPPVYQP